MSSCGAGGAGGYGRRAPTVPAALPLNPGRARRAGRWRGAPTEDPPEWIAAPLALKTGSLPPVLGHFPYVCVPRPLDWIIASHPPGEMSDWARQRYECKEGRRKYVLPVSKPLLGLDVSCDMMYRAPMAWRHQPRASCTTLRHEHAE